MGFLEVFWSGDAVAVSWWRTALRVLHFAGLVLGFGGAVFVDLVVQRASRKGLSLEVFEVVAFASRFVASGLALLWVSGLGFLLLYQWAEPQKLANPKIAAKMTIVVFLTMNGVFVHRVVLPFLRARIGQPLLKGVSARVRTVLSACAAVSVVSWTMPVLLAAAPQLNVVVPYGALLSAYGLALILAFAGIGLLMARAARAPLFESACDDATFAPGMAKAAIE